MGNAVGQIDKSLTCLGKNTRDILCKKKKEVKYLSAIEKEVDRLVNLEPPKETNVPPGYISKLSKCVHGLSDAPRSSYLTLREDLSKSGAVVSKYDQAIFSWYFRDKLHGIIVTHVDDFYFAESEIFQAKIIVRLCHLFKIKSEEVSEFQYIGLSIKESKDNIKIGQITIFLYLSWRRKHFSD